MIRPLRRAHQRIAAAWWSLPILAAAAILRRYLQ